MNDAPCPPLPADLFDPAQLEAYVRWVYAQVLRLAQVQQDKWPSACPPDELLDGLRKSFPFLSETRPAARPTPAPARRGARQTQKEELDFGLG